MSSHSASDQNNCGICLSSMAPGQGQAIFTASCSHSFHYPCIANNVRFGNLCCPICRAVWDKNNVPFQQNNSGFFPPPQNTIGWMPPTPPQFTFPLQQSPSFSTRRNYPRYSHPEQTSFSDDEPLQPTSPTQSSRSQNVTIKTQTEFLAISAAESCPHFPVLVSIRAPALQDPDGEGHTPIDLVTVLDVSGSMAGRKLDLVKRAVKFVIQNLGPSDRLSIVSFSTTARRVFPLRRMTVEGRESAIQAVDSLRAEEMTNIVAGLVIATRVLEERRERNPVASIMLLSDGMDSYCHSLSQLMDNLPTSIRSANMEHEIPVHTFGFGNDHDANIMHAISDASGGTFSCIESVGMIQDSFALCIGGLLSVVAQEFCLTIRSDSQGVKIVAIPSGRYVRNISDEGLQGVVNVGNLYAEEEKQFLIYLFVPQCLASDTKTSLLDVLCVYRDLASNELIQVQGERVEILRPEVCTPADKVVSLEVDRQRNRISVSEAIAEAQGLAEAGNLERAREILTRQRETLLTTPAARAGDDLSSLLEAELQEIIDRMGSIDLYGQSGRAYALAGMSSHSLQRATTRGNTTTSCVSGGFGATNASYSTRGLGATSAFSSASSTPFSSGGFGSTNPCFSTGGSSFPAGGFGASPQCLPTGSVQQQQQQQRVSAPSGAYETSSMLRMVEKSKTLGTGI